MNLFARKAASLGWILRFFGLERPSAMVDRPVRYRPSRGNRPSGHSKSFDGPRDEAHRRRRRRITPALVTEWRRHRAEVLAAR